MGEIQVLTDALALAKSQCVTGIFKKSFLEASGKSLGDWKLYAAICTGGVFLVGSETIGGTFQGLGEAAKEIFKEAPKAKLPQIGR